MAIGDNGPLGGVELSSSGNWDSLPSSLTSVFGLQMNGDHKWLN